MKQRLIFSALFILFVQGIYAQNYSYLKFQCKSRTDKIYIYKLGSCASMKVKDTTYIIPLIINITSDSVTIQKRIYIAENVIEWKPLTFSLKDLVWINWDGIPRKRIKVSRYNILIE